MDTTPGNKADAIGPGMAEASSTRRVVIAGVIGTVIEYFDFLVYATIASLVFGKLFFPSSEPFVGNLLATGTFAVGFLARPVGGIIFGNLSDRFGRRSVLVVTLIMMGSSTVLIGLLPTYATIGAVAPVILVLLRVIQGIGVGGEYGAATVLVVETTNQSGRRGFYGAVVTSGASLGFLLASGLVALLTGVMSSADFLAWGWRIPFLISAVLLIVGIYVRLGIAEPDLMEETLERKETVRVPLLEVFRNHPKQALLAFLTPVGAFVAYYVILTFSIPYAVSQGGSNTTFLLSMLTIGQVLYLVSIILSGWLSDIWGRRVPMLIGGIGLLVWGFGFFPLLLSGSVFGVLLGFTGALVLLGGFYGPMPAFLSELFGTSTRSSGLSFGYQVSAAVAGGLSPVAAVALVGATGSWLPVAVMIAAGMAISVAAVLASRSSLRSDLRD